MSFPSNSNYNPDFPDFNPNNSNFKEVYTPEEIHQINLNFFHQELGPLAWETDNKKAARKRRATEDVEGNSIKREAPEQFYEEAVYTDGWQQADLPPEIYQEVQNSNPQNYYYEDPTAATAAADQHPPPPPHYHQHRPDEAHTPPMDGQQQYHTLTDISQTPAQQFGQPPHASSTMLTPESPETISLAEAPQPAYVPYDSQDSEDRKVAMDSQSSQAALLKTPKIKKEIDVMKIMDDVAAQTAKGRQGVALEKSTTAYPTFQHFGLLGVDVLEEVDGRLPTLGCRSKCSLTTNELKRRIGAPEYMNLSTIYSLFRKSKKKDSITKIKDKLTQNGIDIPRMQRQRKLNCFSGFLEDDAIGLAVDVREIHRKHFNPFPLGQQMFDNMIAKGIPTTRCEQMLDNSMTILQHIINTLTSRQPIVGREQEKLKGNGCDLPYHVFNVSTHGFGHISSIVHYKEQLEVCRQAKYIAERVNNRIPMEAPLMLTDHEHGFELVSDIEAKHMLAIQYYRFVEKLPTNQRTLELQRFALTTNGQQIINILDKMTDI